MHVREVYGCDFSGARRPRGLCYARGLVREGALHIVEIRDLTTRAELHDAILQSDVPWGLDFPFSLPAPAASRLGFDDWFDLIDHLSSLTRREFYATLEEHGLSSREARCQEPGLFCRHTDAAVSSFSALKLYNPKMQGMICGGFQVLADLRRAGVSIHPFDGGSAPQRARVYEVYPSAVRLAAGVSRRSTDLMAFIQGFHQHFGLEVELSEPRVRSKDAADAVIACAGLAWSLLNENLEPDWDRRPPSITDGEWAVRKLEGFIVGPRISPRQYDKDSL